MSTPSPEQHPLRSPSAPLAANPAADSSGDRVNPLSRAVLPRNQFPLHFDFLMKDLFQRGMSPEDWQVIAADEVRLDELGMDVEFTLIRNVDQHVWRRRVDVKHGRLLAIREC